MAIRTAKARENSFPREAEVNAAPLPLALDGKFAFWVQASVAGSYSQKSFSDPESEKPAPTYPFVKIENENDPPRAVPPKVAFCVQIFCACPIDTNKKQNKIEQLMDLKFNDRVVFTVLLFSNLNTNLQLYVAFQNGGFRFFDLKIKQG